MSAKRDAIRSTDRMLAGLLACASSLLGLSACEEDPTASSPSLVMACRPTSLNAVEIAASDSRSYPAHYLERTFCTVTPTNVRKGEKINAFVLDRNSIASRASEEGTTVAAGGFTEPAGCEDDAGATTFETSDLRPEALDEANAPVQFCFACTAGTQGIVLIKAALNSGVETEEVKVTCFVRDHRTFGLEVRPREPVVPLGASVKVDVFGTDTAGGTWVANQLVNVTRPDGGEFEGEDGDGKLPLVLILNTIKETAEPPQTPTFKCPGDKAGLYRVIAEFQDPTVNGDQSGRAFVNCTDERSEPRIQLFAERLTMVADGQDITEITGIVIGPEGPVGSSEEEPVSVQICTDAGTTWVVDEYTIPCAECAWEDRYNPRDQCSAVDIEVGDSGEFTVQLRAGTVPGSILTSARSDLSHLEYVASHTEEFQGGQLSVTGSVNGPPQFTQVGIGEVRYCGATPRILGVRESGFNETSQVCFCLFDTDGATFPAGVRVELDIPNNAGDIGWSPHTGQTDANGRVCTTVRAGRVATNITVRARVRLGAGENQTETAANSTSIPIIGVTPNAGGFALDCAFRNVGALLHTNGIDSLIQHELPCVTKLVDRFSNPVGLSTAVSFRTEAGSIGGSVNTVPLNTGGDGTTAQATTGQAMVFLNTFGQLPKDVEPTPPPVGAPREPRINVEQQLGEDLVRNPRDGLVTVIAFVAGEEQFTDQNGNGIYDQGEPFIDLKEPFVDYDDDNVRDDDEPFIDIELANNVATEHDDENGIWDGHTIIWTQTRVLWSGHPDSVVVQPIPRLCRPGPGVNCGVDAEYALNAGVDCQISAIVRDQNLNLLNTTAVYQWSLMGGSLIEQAQQQIRHTPGIIWRLELVPSPSDPLVQRIRFKILDYGPFSCDPESGGYCTWARIAALSQLPAPGQAPVEGYLPSALVLRVSYTSAPGGGFFWSQEYALHGCYQ